VKIVRGRPETADELTEIAHAAKRHWGYPERWIQSWRETLTIRPDFIAGNVTFCAVEDSRTIGFYILTAESDGLHLDHLWVLPLAMRRGVGRALFNHAIDQAKRLGHTTILIESDPNAEGFYQRMGAERIGVHRGSDEGNPRELPLLKYEVSNYFRVTK
jgi:GNAT superfamily N-acetyltransferase